MALTKKRGQKGGYFWKPKPKPKPKSRSNKSRKAGRKSYRKTLKNTMNKSRRSKDGGNRRNRMFKDIRCGLRKRNFNY